MLGGSSWDFVGHETENFPAATQNTQRLTFVRILAAVYVIYRGEDFII